MPIVICFHWVLHSTASSTPFPNFGVVTPTPKLARRLTRERSEISYRFQQINYVSSGLRGVLLTAPTPPSLKYGRVPHAKLVWRLVHNCAVRDKSCGFIRHSMSNTAGFHGYHTKPPNFTLSQKLGSSPLPYQPQTKLVWLLARERSDIVYRLGFNRY